MNSDNNKFLKVQILMMTMLLSLNFSFSQNNWQNNPFEQKVFIENKGQFENPLKLLDLTNKKNVFPEIVYGGSSNGIELFFSKQGLIYSQSALVKLNAEEKEKYEKRIVSKESNEEGDEEADISRLKPQYLSIEWLGANKDVEIISENPVDFYYTYGSFADNYNKTTKAPAFKKIIYKNLYPKIDVEYVFPEDRDGIKYNIILHPGANVSDIKMSYKNANKISLFNHEIRIENELGKFIDHTPVTFNNETKAAITSSFVLNGNIVSFSLPFSVNNTRSDIIIDPWTTNPTYTGFNSAYDVNFDLAGNVYTHGSYNPYKIAKFNSSGALQWIFNASLGSTFITRITYGDFAVDEITSSIYVTEGYNNSGTGARILKVNPSGTQIASFPGNVNFQEMWRAEYNRCIGKIVIAGGGHRISQAAIMDTTLNTLTSVNVLGAIEDQHDMCMLAVDNVSSNCFMATARSGSYPNNFDNVILKCPIPALLPISPTFGMKKNYHNTKEVRSVRYINNFTPAATLVPTNAFNGMAVSPNWLYTYNSDTLKRWDKNTGALSAVIDVDPAAPMNYGGTIQVRWGGVAVDECDNLYVGFANTINVYNSSLSLVNTYVLSDTVYDLKIGNANKLYACGKGFVTEISVPVNPITTSFTPASGCGACDGTATVNTCGGGNNPGVSYSWNTSPVQTTQTATGLCPGTYIVTVNASCVVSFKDTIVITGTPATTPTTQNINICAGNSYTLPGGAVVSATGTYKDTVQNGNGCDSIITTNLTVTPYLTSSQNPVICNGTSFTLPGGASVGVSGTYYDTLATTGCDSIVTTNLTVNPSYSITASPTICPGNNYTLPGGNIVSSAGTYIDTLTTMNGCDSIITTNLSLSNLITSSQNPVICQGASFTLPDNSVVNTSGVYIDTISTLFGGCDSVITTTLTVNPVFASSQSPVICAGTIYSLPGGTSTTVSGVYIDTLATTNGCDSIITTNLTVNPVYSSSTNITICSNSTYTLPSGLVVNTTGLYIDTLNTYKGCDSIISTNLVVNPVKATSVSATIVCQGQSYTLPGGNIVYTSGVYKDTLLTTNGCDSVVTTTVTLNPSPIASFTANPTTGTPPLTVVFTNTSQNANTYLWTFGDGASSTQTNPTHIYSTVGTYVVTLIASVNGYCPDTTSMTIIVLENFGVLVPNVFTPNNDGKNDVFTVNTEGVKAIDAEIYDRWGLKMYEWHTTDGGWDGYTSAGLPATDGTYYYIIKLTEFSGKTHYFKGPFTLIK